MPASKSGCCTDEAELVEPLAEAPKKRVPLRLAIAAIMPTPPPLPAPAAPATSSALVALPALPPHSASMTPPAALSSPPAASAPETLPAPSVPSVPVALPAPSATPSALAATASAPASSGGVIGLRNFAEIRAAIEASRECQQPVPADSSVEVLCVDTGDVDSGGAHCVLSSLVGSLRVLFVNSVRSFFCAPVPLCLAYAHFMSQVDNRTPQIFQEMCFLSSMPCQTRVQAWSLP